MRRAGIRERAPRVPRQVLAERDPLHCVNEFSCCIANSLEVLGKVLLELSARHSAQVYLRLLHAQGLQNLLLALDLDYSRIIRIYDLAQLVRDTRLLQADSGQDLFDGLFVRNNFAK